MLKLLYLRLKLFRLYKKDAKTVNEEESCNIHIEIENLLRLIYTEDHRHFYNQRTFVWCPVCNQDLVSSNSISEDTDYVYYQCSNCNTKSKWNFDCICPILISYKK